MSGKHFWFVVKILIFLFACYFIAGYISEYDIPQRIKGARFGLLALVFFLYIFESLTRVLMLKTVAGDRIGFIECVRIETYTFLMNLGVASSFFSLPKIAFINKNLKDIRASFGVYALPIILGGAAKAYVLVLAGILWFSGYMVCFAVAVFISALYILVTVQFKSYVRRLTGVESQKMMMMGVLSFSNALISASCFYLILFALSGRAGEISAAAIVEGGGFLAGYLSPIPTGIGVREVASTEIGSLFGLGAELVFSASLLQRLISWSCQLMIALALIVRDRLVSS